MNIKGKDTLWRKNNVIELVQPGEFKDQLTEILRQGAQTLVMQAVEAEFAEFLDQHTHEKYKVKYPQATSCLDKDRSELLAFYDPHFRGDKLSSGALATYSHHQPNWKHVCHS